MKKMIAWSAWTVFIVALSMSGNPGPQQPLVRPDLVISDLTFQKVESGTDAAGKTYWLFNVGIKVKNQGNGNAGAFKVLLERNNGAGGAYQTACQTCLIDVPGLGAGQDIALQPRQFNNAMGMSSKFRATTDSAGQISESNEGNNSREEAFISMSVTDVGGGVGHLAKPDLTVVGFDFTSVSQSTVSGKIIISFTIAATIKNLGPAPSGACHLEIERGSDQHATVLWLKKPVPGLAAGAQTVITATSTHEFGTPPRWYQIIVDIDHEVAESNEDNNVSGHKQFPIK